MDIQPNPTTVYHGSSELIDIIVPRRNRRFSATKGVIWDRISFHATPYRWIALAYISNRRNMHTSETMGVDLYEHIPVITIVGPTTLDDALNNLYGKGGYLYEFDAKDFTHEEGLGKLEVYTDQSVIPIRVERIDNPVAKLRQLGIHFEFRRGTKFDQHNI